MGTVGTVCTVSLYVKLLMFSGCRKTGDTVEARNAINETKVYKIKAKNKIKIKIKIKIKPAVWCGKSYGTIR